MVIYVTLLKPNTLYCIRITATYHYSYLITTSTTVISVTIGCVVVCGNIGWYPIRAGVMPPCPHAVAVLPPLPQAFRSGKSSRFVDSIVNVFISLTLVELYGCVYTIKPFSLFVLVAIK